jgi:hypothetical protein
MIGGSRIDLWCADWPESAQRRRVIRRGRPWVSVEPLWDFRKHPKESDLAACNGDDVKMDKDFLDDFRYNIRRKLSILTDNTPNGCKDAPMC